MYALIPLVIIIFILTIVALIKDKSVCDGMMVIGAFIGAFIMSAIAAVTYFGVSVLLFAVFNCNDMWPYVKSESQERIVSLRDNQNFKLEGSFILGCGTVIGYTEDDYITYVVINENPITYKRKCFPINKTALVEDDNTYVKYTTVTAKRYKWLLTPMPSSTEYELHVPKGTYKNLKLNKDRGI